MVGSLVKKAFAHLFVIPSYEMYASNVYEHLLVMTYDLMVEAS